MTVFVRGPAAAQRIVSPARFHEWVLADGTLWTLFYRTGPGYLLRFPQLADFHVSSDGATVQGHPVDGVSDATFEHLYLNQVLPLAMSRQGKLVFHASAVALPQGAVAFMGRSGQGKSTLAASFAAVGLRFLTDDGLLLAKLADHYVVQPSHPSIRLWDDSRDALVHKAATLAPPIQYAPKARVMSDDALPFCAEPRPLRRVYFLGNQDVVDVTIEPVRPSEALIGLVNHSFLLDIEAEEVISRHFDDLTQMVTEPIYYRLDYRRRYEDLPRVRDAIIQHASAT